jgi:hypothetical protein
MCARPGLKTSFARLLDGTVVQIGFGEAAFAFALNCLLDPMSKLRVGEWAKTIYRPEWERLEPNHFSFRHAVEKVKHQVLPEAGDSRGMVSEKLPGEIEGAQLEYIVGVRMRKLKAAREVFFRPGRYRKEVFNQ